MFIVPEITAVGWLIYALLFFGLYVTVVIFIVFLDNVADLEKRRRDICTDAGDMPPLTILIPAFNEEAAIAQSIQGAVDSEYPKVKCFVVDGKKFSGNAQKRRKNAIAWCKSLPKRILPAYRFSHAFLNAFVFPSRICSAAITPEVIGSESVN